MSIKDLEMAKTPRGKALQNGFNSLSDIELLAIILQMGAKGKDVYEISQEVLNMTDNLSGLFDLTANELMTIYGIKEAKALQLLAGVELCKRALKAKVYRQRMLKPEDIVEWFELEYGYKNQEHFIVAYLDTQLQFIKHKVIFVGTLTEAIVNPREIMKEALLCSAFSIICVHNHPSGVTNPSRQDIELTERLRIACLNMGIVLFDHIIIGRGAHFSFKLNGYLD